jgi:hypothetical protein
MKLYDMENVEWKGADFKKSEHWRSKQVYKCGICGCETNEFYMSGAFWGGGPRLVCHGMCAKPELHNLLVEKVMNSQESKHPKKYIEALLEDIEELRQQFKDIPPNVKGIEGDYECIEGRYCYYTTIH